MSHLFVLACLGNNENKNYVETEQKQGKILEQLKATKSALVC